MNRETTSEVVFERRLAAIVVADLAGYSRMVAEDEAGTVTRMREIRDEVTEPIICEAGGRVVKRTGDGTLVEFASVLAAARSAIDVQRQLAEIAASEPGDRRFVLRIGLHLGEILVEPDGDIHGDGVNVAARLEALCAPGEILLSGAAWEHVEGHVDVRTEALGPRELKNIPRKVPLYRLIPVEGGVTSPEPEPGKMALPLPDKPSIMVLPFENLSADPDQEFFCDGLVEDVITALSRFRSLFVIARNTAFTYRGRTVAVKDVGREVGVQYVLEGSVRRAGSRIRVTAQLVDAVADRHVWAEKWDRSVEDVFDVQDELTSAIAAQTNASVSVASPRQTHLSGAEALPGWERLARARWHWTKFDQEGFARAIDLLSDGTGEAATGADSELALIRIFEAVLGWSRPPADSMKLAMVHAQKAVAEDDRDDNALAVLGGALIYALRHQEGIAVLERADRLNPNNPLCKGTLGFGHIYLREFEKGEALIGESLRLSPADPMNAPFMQHAGASCVLRGDLDAARDWMVRIRAAGPNWPIRHRFAVCVHGHRGETAEAAEALARALEHDPNLTISSYRKMVPFANEEDAELFCKGLRLGGMRD